MLGVPPVPTGATDQTGICGRVSVVDETVRSSEVTAVVDNRMQESVRQVGRTQELHNGRDSIWFEAMLAATKRPDAQEVRDNVNDGQISPSSMLAVTLETEDNNSANRAAASNARNETVGNDASLASFNSSGIEDKEGGNEQTLSIRDEAPLPII